MNGGEDAVRLVPGSPEALLFRYRSMRHTRGDAMIRAGLRDRGLFSTVDTVGEVARWRERRMVSFGPVAGGGVFA
jgi:hypothetical protein